MQGFNGRFGLTVWLLTMASGGPVGAQTSSSFERLALLVEAGDRITVIDSIGEEHTGRIAAISPSGLELIVDEARHDFSEANVETIRQWRHDPVRNGVLLGLAIGAGVGATAFRRSSDLSAPALIFGLSAAAGAGIGTLVDTAVPSWQIIYQSTNTAQRLNITPLLASNRRGIAVSFGF